MKEGDGCEQRHHQRAQDDCLPRSKTGEDYEDNSLKWTVLC